MAGSAVERAITKNTNSVTPRIMTGRVSRRRPRRRNRLDTKDRS
jgi:hypothetical protein